MPEIQPDYHHELLSGIDSAAVCGGMESSMNEFNGGTDRSYCGYASRFVIEEKGELRSGIEFEVIQSQKVSAFLKRDKALALNSQDEAYISLLNHYLEYGMDNDEFYQKKLAYFGSGEVIDYLTIWFNKSSEAEQIVITSWYDIKDGGEYDYQVIPFIGEEEKPVITGKCSLSLTEKKEKDTLNELMKVHSQEGKTIQAKRELNEEMIQAINSETKFLAAIVYYVGAALCVSLYSGCFTINSYRWFLKRLEVYFDFGYKGGKTSENAAIQLKSGIAERNLRIILRDLWSSPEKIVIISHLHYDHISLLRHIIGDPKYDLFWARSTWYIPQTNAPIKNIIAEQLKSHGGKLIEIPNVFPANDQVFMINDNPDLIYGKIDAFDPAIQDGKHPHHHGLYAKVSIIDDCNLFNRQMLLTGDCTYSGIPDDQKNGCAFLQACHHGGNYSLPPCPKDPAANISSIPIPTEDDNYKYVIYSANGVSHEHPNVNIVDQHRARGWTKDVRTYSDSAINGQLVVSIYGVR